MRHDLELAYVGIEMPDPATLTPFFTDVIGLVAGDSDGQPGTVTWRNDDKARRLLIQPGPANDACVVGLEAVDAAAFDRTAAHLADHGYVLTEGSKTDAEARRVDRLAHTEAPWGVRVELVQGLQNAATPFASPLVPGGFYTRGVGLGHDWRSGWWPQALMRS